MEPNDDLIFGERYEDLVPGLVLMKGFELDEDWTLHLRRPLAALGRQPGGPLPRAIAALPLER